MYFINSRKRINLSFFVLTVLLTSAAVLIFAAANSSANSVDNRAGQEKKESLQTWQRGISAGRRKTGRFDFSANNSARSAVVKTNHLMETSAQGDLDTTFGSGGKVTTQIGSSSSQAMAVALQSDGKFVSAGFSFNGSNTDFALARYTSNGSSDTTFGSGGKVTTDIGSADNESLAVAIQPADGKIIAAGSSFNGSNDDFALVRYNTDGTLDGTFGTGGIATTDFGGSSEYIEAVVIQSDGKIVVAGDRLSNSVFHFALARYNSNGTLDTTFGTGGKLTTNVTNFDDLARAIALQSDGKIVVAGEGNADFAVVRYNSDGSLDTTFDGDGIKTNSINLFDSAYDLAIQTDGKIVAAGEAGDGNNSDFALARYNTNGSLDSTFDGDGIVTTAIGGGDEFATSLALVSGGKIFAGGFSFNGANDDFALVRYNSDGSLDSSFGSGGKVTTDFANSFDDIAGLAVQSNSRIIAVGTSGSNFAAAAYSLGSTGCSYSLTPMSADFPSNGGTGSFTITTGAGCPRAAISNNPWIIITSDNSGTGSGVVTFIVGSNSGAARTGTITAAGGLTFSINEPGGTKSHKRARFF